MVPLQVDDTPLGVEITRPAGSVSVNPVPVSDVVVFGLLRLKVSEVEPFNGIDAAPNAIDGTAGETTVRLAFEVFPAPPFVEFTVTLLFLTPAVVPVTLTETVQDAPGARDALERLTEDAPLAADAVPVHVLFRLLGVAITNPAGRLSVKEMPFRVRDVLELVRVKVRLVAPFSGMVAALKAFVMAGGLITVRVAEAVLPGPAFVDVIVPVVLF